MKTIVLKCLAPAALLGMLALPLIAHADDSHHHMGINARLRHQDQRIDQGRNSGQLNGRQENRLEARDTRIHRQERRDRMANGNGRLTGAERRRLQQRLNRTSGAIYGHKH